VIDLGGVDQVGTEKAKEKESKPGKGRPKVANEPAVSANEPQKQLSTADLSSLFE
jgi:hypothetical protein